MERTANYLPPLLAAGHRVFGFCLVAPTLPLVFAKDETKSYNMMRMKTYRDRIVVDPNILIGKPVIKGTRIPVYLIVNLVTQGKSYDYILKDYPDLTKDDITVALQYAADSTNFSEDTIAPQS